MVAGMTVERQAGDDRLERGLRQTPDLDELHAASKNQTLGARAKADSRPSPHEVVEAVLRR
jgi:hypothetical protein